MGGDGMQGLALAIFGAMLCMVAVPALAAGALGWLVARRRAGWLGALVGALLGGVLGAIAVTATFFEDVWSPRPTVTVEVPAGFAHEWVYLVGDPSSSVEVEWSGVDVPFSARSGRIAAPRSGIVRVRTLEHLDGGNVGAQLSIDGTLGPESQGSGGLNTPPGLGSGRVVTFGFASYPGTEPEPPTDPAALAARILLLEQER
ncbi:MAG: hypothetical protein M3Y87_09845 [Myxococcota bacterium]|nr:hypothetical protein [Myxococcota bacterium]